MVELRSYFEICQNFEVCKTFSGHGRFFILCGSCVPYTERSMDSVFYTVCTNINFFNGAKRSVDLSLSTSNENMAVNGKYLVDSIF